MVSECKGENRLSVRQQRGLRAEQEDRENGIILSFKILFSIECLVLSIKESNKCGSLACMKKAKDIYKSIVRKPDGNNPFVKPRHT